MLKISAVVYALTLIIFIPNSASAVDWKSGLGLGFEKMQKVCIQFYTLNKKCIDCVEPSSIPLCCKIPSRLVPPVSKGPYYGNLFFSEKSSKIEKNGNEFTAR